MQDKAHMQGETDMRNMHVLALMPPSRKDRSTYLVQVLQAAKARWGWRVSALCDGLERDDFRTITVPDGNAIGRPHLLHEAEWERDPAEVLRTEESMRAAERAAGTTAGRIILAAGHSVGRGYNLSVRHIRKYLLVRRVIGDNREPLRIVRRLFRFAEDMLDREQPDLVYAFEWATPLHHCVWLAAQKRGIPCIALRYSKVLPDQAFWTTDRVMMNDRAIALGIKLRQSGATMSEQARAYIRAFCDQPRVINYIATRWSNKASRGIIRWHLQNGQVVIREFVNRFRGQDLALREPPFSRFARYYHSLYLGFAHQKYFHVLDEETLAKTKYVYFPLHKEAELAQTFQATLWHDQRNTVRVLASLLPHGYRLLVREHRMNLGHRPTKSFKEYADIPNVTMIDPYDSQFKYLKHADLVVTENGSSGWEGLMLGRKVLTVSRTFYDAAGLATQVRDPERLNAILLEALAENPNPNTADWERALGCVIDAERQTTFPTTKEGAAVALDRLQDTLAASQRTASAA
jgi:hypothetical protein